MFILYMLFTLLIVVGYVMTTYFFDQIGVYIFLKEKLSSHINPHLSLLSFITFVIDKQLQKGD